MPAYDYECSNCGEIFEECIKSPREFSKCLECGAKSRRLYSAPNIIFKGAGFYKTDYENKNNRNEE